MKSGTTAIIARKSNISQGILCDYSEFNLRLTVVYRRHPAAYSYKNHSRACSPNAFTRGACAAINSRALIPRQETETLCETGIAHLRALGPLPPPAVLDLCTGSGALAVTIAAQRPDARVVACDISEEALCVARENAAGLNVSFARGDLFAAVEGAFDVIVCNPPYLTAEDMLSLQREVRYEPALALRGGAAPLRAYFDEILGQKSR